MEVRKELAWSRVRQYDVRKTSLAIAVFENGRGQDPKNVADSRS